MRRKKDRDTLGNLFQSVENANKGRLLINIRRAMQSEHCVSLSFQSKFRSHLRFSRVSQIAKQRINHDIANQTDTIRGDSFRQQVLIGILRGREEQVCDLICQESINFFRHRTIPTAQAGFDVRDLHG